MLFAQKLTILLEIAGLTNSKLARTLRVDPSLVSRWRGGTRKPQENAPVMVQLAACLARNISTRHQRSQLAQYIGGAGAERLSVQDLTDLIFTWLSQDGSQRIRTASHLEPGNFTPAELAFSNSFSGPEGRRLVIEQLFAQFHQQEEDVSILFYSSDPASWIQSDIEYRSTMPEEHSALFHNVSTVKLMVNNGATEDEYLALLHYMLPFLHNSFIQIAQIPRYRRELFTNTILIAGSHSAAASHGFASSENFMTNIYTNPDFIHGLTRDFERQFAECDRIHSTEKGVTLLDLMEEEGRMYQHPADIVFVGNVTLATLLPTDVLAGLDHGQDGITGATGTIAGGLSQHTRQLEVFLHSHSLHMYIPLYSPKELAQDIVTLPGLSADTTVTVSAPHYRRILAHLLQLMEHYPRLSVHFIHRLAHQHTMVIQPGHQMCVLKAAPPSALYITRLHSIIAAFVTYVQQTHTPAAGSDSAERAQQMALLRRRIEELGL